MSDNETKVAAHPPAGDRFESGQQVTDPMFDELAQILADALVADVEGEPQQAVA